MQVRSCFRGLLGGVKVLICDRFIYDMLADLAINFDRRGEGIIKLARHPLVRLFPKPDAVFFLDVPPGVAWDRKKDPNVMDEQYLVDRAEAYATLSKGLGFIRVDGTRTVEEIAADVLTRVLCMIGRAGSEVCGCQG